MDWSLRLHGEVTDKGAGMEIGVEDSVSKHFSEEELGRRLVFVQQIENGGENLHGVLAVQ